MSVKSVVADRRTLAIYARFGMKSCPECGAPFEEGMKLVRLGRGPVRCAACAGRISEGSQQTPPELQRIYELLDAEVLPVLAAAGVPIVRADLRQMFYIWFDRTAPKPIMVLTGAPEKRNLG